VGKEGIGERKEKLGAIGEEVGADIQSERKLEVGYKGLKR